MTQHASAQAQAQKNITEQESLGMVQSLLRVSIYHMTQLRGLFPDSYYEDVTMKKLDGMKIKVLKPRDEESKRLVDWIDAGAYDAISKGYLKTMFFSISKDIDGRDLLEEYLYNFSYGPDGIVSMDYEKKRSSGPPENLLNVQGQQQGTVSSVRYQVIRLMRMLVQLCRTLDEVPTERYLFCRFAYYEETPDDYEPPFFKASLDETLGRFSRRPFAMRVGGTTTPHHQVSLTLKSLLCQDDEEDYEGEEDQGEVSHGGGGSKCPSEPPLPPPLPLPLASQPEAEPVPAPEPLPLASSIAMLEVKAKGAQQVSSLNKGGGSIDTGGAEVGGGKGLYEATIEFAMRHKQVDVEDLLGNFVEIRDASHALSFLERMHESGLIKPIAAPAPAIKGGGSKVKPSALTSRPGVYTVVPRQERPAVPCGRERKVEDQVKVTPRGLIPESALDAPSELGCAIIVATSKKGHGNDKTHPVPVPAPAASIVPPRANRRGGGSINVAEKSEAELEQELLEMEMGGMEEGGGDEGKGPEVSEDITMAPSDQQVKKDEEPKAEDAVMRDAVDEGGGNGNIWIEGSQQSQAVHSSRKRKVSVVSDPIRQSPGKTKRLMRSTAESLSQEVPIEGTQVIHGNGVQGLSGAVKGGAGAVMAARNMGLPPKGRQNPLPHPIPHSKPFPSLSAASGGGSMGGGGVSARAVQGRRR